MTASLRWSQQSGGNQGLQLPRAWQSFQPGEKPPHSGQGWVPPTVWEEAAPFRAGMGAPTAWGPIPGRAGCPCGLGLAPHSLGLAPSGRLAQASPWTSRWYGVPSYLVSPDGFSEVRNLPKQKAELFSNRLENYEKNMQTPIEG